MDTEHAKRHGERRFNHRGGHRNRGWNVMSRRKREAAPASRFRPKIVTTPPPPPLMHVMKYTVPSVLVFATLRYQGKPQALLLENPAAMWCFVAATCVYWLVAGEMKQKLLARGGSRFRIYTDAALASGILSGVLVVSMLLPHPVSIWIPLTAGLMLFAAVSLISKGIKSIASKIHVVEELCSPV